MEYFEEFKPGIEHANSKVTLKVYKRRIKNKKNNLLYSNPNKTQKKVILGQYKRILKHINSKIKKL